jgi:hypothetical protein
VNRCVYIIGTRHDFQVEDGKRSAADIAAFSALIQEACKRLGIAALAEEMSLEALRQRTQESTVCQKVACSMSLIHRFCDPDTSTREAHGIRPEGDLHLEVFFERLPPEELENAIRTEHAKREALWLDELQHSDAWPVLFVCGAKHAGPFRELLRQSGLTAEVLVVDWLPVEAPEPMTAKAGKQRPRRKS